VLTFRTAAPADLDRLIEIHSSAYPDPRGPEERRKKFVANPRGDLAALHVAEDGGQIVAHAFLFSLRAWFAGGVVPIGGIASVAVAPEARGRGVAAALLSYLHQRADAARAAVTMLYPFRQGYYAKHGYAAVTPNRRLALHPGSIPSAWRDEPGIAIRTVRADPASPAADRTAIVNAYARAAARTHGWVARPPALWDHFFANERRVWLLATRGRRAVGYVCWSLAQIEPYATTRLAVHELVADDAAARRALLGAIGSQRDQVAEVEMEVDAHDPIDRALVDADRGRFGSPQVEHPLGVLSGGPMVRLVDVSRGLAARAYAADGEIDVVIDRAPDGEHQVPSRPALHVAVADGKAKLSVPAKPARAPLAIDRAALAAVLYGGLSASDAARLGWARGEDATLERADALFASPPFFALDAY
jgi:predicted acetyltransferase